MNLLAQLPGAGEAIKVAASRGWEAVLLVVIVASTFCFFGYVLRRVLDAGESRETRLAERVTILEAEIRTELFGQLRANTEIMARMVDAANRICAATDRMIQTMDKFETTLASRPCLATISQYARRVACELEETAEGVADTLRETARSTAKRLDEGKS
jgi:hypothetical protein